MPAARGALGAQARGSLLPSQADEVLRDFFHPSSSRHAALPMSGEEQPCNTEGAVPTPAFI